MTLTWSAPRTAAGALVITAIDAHAAGEPLRIITGGLPELPGATILERRRYLRDHLDHVRRALMWEPRGHADMYGCVVTPPVTPEAVVGVIFLHNAGYSTMCGHGVIALVTVLVETGTLPARGPETPIGLDTPAGLVRATAHLDAHGHVTRVTFINVPSFVYARDVVVDGPNGERVTVDVAFGGAYYAVAPAAAVGLRVAPDQVAALVHAGEAIKAAANATLTIHHPGDSDLGFLYGTILTDEPEDPAHHSRNCCVFADAEVDRSPTGTGVAARLAVLHARGQVAEGDAPSAIESILGAPSVFTGRVVSTTTVGPYPAVVPEVGGTAHITGRHEFILDPADPLGRGFLVR